MLRSLIAAACLYAAASAPAFAQVGLDGLFQGPWNVHAQPAYSQRSSRSGWVPPRNAQCGWYLRKKLGHGDAGLNLAQNWARKLPRTSARHGAVVVWTPGGNKGHVAQIVSMQGHCRAVVHDNAGTYSRDICRRVIAYVQP